MVDTKDMTNIEVIQHHLRVRGFIVLSATEIRRIMRGSLTPDDVCTKSEKKAIEYVQRITL